jgi:hypothetical protein
VNSKTAKEKRGSLTSYFSEIHTVKMTYKLQIYKWNPGYLNPVSNFKYDISIAYKTIIHIPARLNIRSKMWKNISY